MERFFVNQVNNNQVVVGGVRKLTEFDRSRVVVLVAGAQVVINGDGLKIARFDENEICIEGKIVGVETLGREVRRNVIPSVAEESQRSLGSVRDDKGRVVRRTQKTPL